MCFNLDEFEDEIDKNKDFDLHENIDEYDFTFFKEQKNYVYHL